MILLLATIHLNIVNMIVSVRAEDDKELFKNEIVIECEKDD